MEPATSALIAATIVNLAQIAMSHNKPADWKPTPDDVRDFLLQIQEATPENLKNQARQRLGLPIVP